jgi:hypothetical protein
VSVERRFVVERSVIRLVVAGFVLLNLMNVVGIVLDDRLSRDAVQWLTFGSEANPVAWVSSMTFFAAALVALVISTSVADTKIRRGWHLLAGLLVLLSVDEATELHEKLDTLVLGRSHVDGAGGLLHYAWIIPGVVLIAGVAVFFLPWLRRIDRPMALLIVAAGATTVLGGVGAEAVSGMVDERGYSWQLWRAVTTVEENLELAGASMLLIGLVHRAVRSVRLVSCSEPTKEPALVS